MKRIRETADNPKFIPGIYNYCDSWCERCAFTAQCLNYSMLNDFSSDENSEMSEENFDDEMSMLPDVNSPDEETSFDIIDDIDDFIERRKTIREAAEENEIAKAAFNYSENLGDFLKPFNNNRKEDPDEIQILRWYQHLIYVKISRALGSKADEENDDFEIEFQKDSDGSAKVALIGIDKSISALEKFKENLKDNSSAVILLSQLINLRKEVENEFPEARKFVRPGFDTQN